jgi:hypothetical protein
MLIRRGKPKRLGNASAPFPLHLPQLSLEFIRELTRCSAIGDQSLTVCTVAREGLLSKPMVSLWPLFLTPLYSVLLLFDAI